MFKLPDFLSKATGAANFADPLKNGGLPTLGDAMQGIGHSMMTHYRGDPQGQSTMPLNIPPMPMMPTFGAEPPPVPLGQVQLPQKIGGQLPWGGLPLSSVLKLF